MSSSLSIQHDVQGLVLRTRDISLTIRRDGFHTLPLLLRAELLRSVQKGLQQSYMPLTNLMFSQRGIRAQTMEYKNGILSIYSRGNSFTEGKTVLMQIPVKPNTLQVILTWIEFQIPKL